MSFRTVYGHSHSENGWPMVDQGSCEWITVPGTQVRLQIQSGWPLIILRAFAADFNAFVEPLRDPDSACWTPTNAVGSSNHLSGTACDFNWNSHPFRVLNAGFDDAKIATIRELLDFYEETVWWGNDWDNPKDAMHFQCGYDTYENPHTGEFIVRKIRADGYSTFRRGNEPVPEQLSRPDTYAVAIIREGQRRGISPRGIQIALAAALVESGLKNYANSRVPESLALDHDAVGSDGYSVGVFQQQIVRGDGGRWWWGDAHTCMNPTLAAGLFYDRLDHLPYDSPAHSPGWYAQTIQRSAFGDRYDQRFGDAVVLYDRLSDGGDELDAHQAAMLADIHNALFSPQKSASKYADPDGRLWRLVELLHNIDSMSHETLIEKQALLGNPAAIALVLREANKGDEWARTVYRSCPGVKDKRR